MGRRRGVLATVALASAALLVSGCGSYTDPSPADPTTPTTTAPAPTPTPDTSPSPTAEPTATPPSEDELPGEAVEGYPDEGTDLVVIGVPAVEELNVRLGPGTAYDTVDRLAPDAEVASTGRSRELGDGEGLWYEIQGSEGLLGWVSADFLAELGVTRDVTDAFDPLPRSRTVNGLVEEVTQAWRDGATGPDGVLVDGPVTTQAMQMSIDLLDGPDRPDESVRGVRLRVVSERGDAGYRVERVSLTQICASGASAGGCD